MGWNLFVDGVKVGAHGAQHAFLYADARIDQQRSVLESLMEVTREFSGHDGGGVEALPDYELICAAFQGERHLKLQCAPILSLLGGALQRKVQTGLVVSQEKGTVPKFGEPK